MRSGSGIAGLGGLIPDFGVRFAVRSPASRPVPGPGFTRRRERRGPQGAPAQFGRRGMLLVVVLAIITVLGLLGASFSFRMNADLASVDSMNSLQQARWAARSGLDRAVHLLRDERTDTDAWYNNPTAFRRILVWAPGEGGEEDKGGSELVADQETVEGRPAWRFSVVSYMLDGDDAKVRYGLTDEASKINLNTASRAQLLALFDQIELHDISPEQLADALIDWRDDNDAPVSLNGAESSYYITLDPAYRSKSRPLQTVEELLMIKGFTGRILYGEDYNRNGYPDENEQDGDEGVFPPDNGDDILDRGILPLVTVYSWDFNFANDNKPRIPLNSIQSVEILEVPDFEYLADEVSVEIIEFIADANRRGYNFQSVGELLGLEVYENGVSNYTAEFQAYERMVTDLERDRLEEEPGEELDEDQEPEPEEEEDIDELGLDKADFEEDREDESRGDEPGGRDGEYADEEDEEEKPGPGTRRQQSLREQDENRRGGRRRGGNRDESDDLLHPEDQGEPGDPDQWRPTSHGGVNEGEGQNVLYADDGGEKGIELKGTPIISPVTAQDMVVIMDRLTAVASPLEPLKGLINVNTASARVLRTIPGLTEEDVASIVATRSRLSGEDKASLGWLVAHGVLEPKTFALVSNLLTTRSIQFTVEVIGFADHVGAFKRIQAVVEMRGHVAQTKYYRDITSLGIGYPAWEDERSEGFAFEDF